MKEQHHSSNKTKAALVLLIVMILILLSNFYRLQNAKKASDAMHTIFNDRLVVANYIFQYTNLMHTIKTKALYAQLSDIQKKAEITSLTVQIHAIDRLYLKTVLTPIEKKQFTSFLSNCIAIENSAQLGNWKTIALYSDQSLKTLNQLANIQISEGKRNLEHANLIYRENTSWGEFQTGLLVVLGATALYLLMAKKKKLKLKIPEAPSMN